MENFSERSNVFSKIRFGNRWYDLLIQVVAIFISITASSLFNEWREKQKNREQEVFYLRQIRNDITEDLKELHNDRESYIFVKKGYVFYKEYDAEKNSFPDSLKLYFNIFFRETFPQINNLGFETIQQNGKLDIISNPLILHQLLKINQELLPEVKSSIEAYLRFRRENVYPFILKNIRINKKTRKSNMREMLLNPEFFNYMLFGSNGFEEILQRYQVLIDEYQTLQKLIDADLKK